MKYWSRTLALVLASALISTTAMVQDLNPMISTTIGNMRIQLDNFSKDIARIGDMRLQSIYKDLDGQLKGFCKVIYCDDDRKNYVDGASIEQKAADATVLFVRQGRLTLDTSSGTWSLPTNGAGLCTPDQIADANKTRPPKDHFAVERFYDEPAPGFCSGFKVGKDLVATAGHCVKNALDCQGIRLVSGFRMDGSVASPTKNISRDRIFACKEIVSRSDNPDWAIIRVEREMENVTQVTLNKTGKPAVASAVTVVGYPMGLPVKIAGNGNVRSVDQHHFVTNTDTYGGNSGSAVFSSDKLVQGALIVEGILVRGEDDFVQEFPCRISKRCEAKACRGEDVTLAQEFIVPAGQ